jgi:hypothetical protein
VIRKIAKPWNEVQLGFAFFSEEAAISSTTSERDTLKAQKIREATSKSYDLAEALPLVQNRLLEASLADVSSQLLPLLELCEAALTRALDVVAARETEPLFSIEEQRSLRGIGQAQWLLTEKLARRETRSEEKRTRKKKSMIEE